MNKTILVVIVSVSLILLISSCTSGQIPTPDYEATGIALATREVIRKTDIAVVETQYYATSAVETLVAEYEKPTFTPYQNQYHFLCPFSYEISNCNCWVFAWTVAYHGASYISGSDYLNRYY